MNDNERVARLETKVDFIENDIREIKLDVRDLRAVIDTNFKWTVSVLITSGCSVIASVIGIAVHFIK